MKKGKLFLFTFLLAVALLLFAPGTTQAQDVTNVTSFSWWQPHVGIVQAVNPALNQACVAFSDGSVTSVAGTNPQNTWNQVGKSGWLVAWAAVPCDAAADNVIFTSSDPYVWTVVARVSNVVSVGQVSVATGLSWTGVTGPVTVGAGEVLLGAYANHGNFAATAMADPAYTMKASINYGQVSLESRISTAAGQISSSMTWSYFYNPPRSWESGPPEWFGILLSLKTVTATPPPPPTATLKIVYDDGTLFSGKATLLLEGVTETLLDTRLFDASGQASTSVVLDASQSYKLIILNALGVEVARQVSVPIPASSAPSILAQLAANKLVVTLSKIDGTVKSVAFAPLP